MHVILSTLHSKYIHASLALPYLASYCTGLPCRFEIREFTTHEPKESVLALLLEGNPDVIAFSVYLWNRAATLELVDALQAVRPEIRIVLGGPEVSFDGHELLTTHPGIDALIRGEGEGPMRDLLEAWLGHGDINHVPRLVWRNGMTIHEGPHGSPLANLDDIPSPFAAELVDLSRGFTYLETSRGCPYRCSFCMSALDTNVRSFSMDRICSDLKLLMERNIPKIKLVDRTFNYDASRAREIFAYILKHNRESHFHFEVGAHLLDETTLELLRDVPQGMFQFEIGVQTTSQETLEAIDRRINLENVLKNVGRLREAGNIDLHLDLIAGLPGEPLARLLPAIDALVELEPHHLQIEPVKLLPGSPLRADATRLGIRFDPNPPYTVLETPAMSFDDLEEVRSLSRLLDMTWNQERMRRFLDALAQETGSFAEGLRRMAAYLQRQGEMRHPLSQRGLFEAMARGVEVEFPGESGNFLLEHLARDFALSERVPMSNPPAFFDHALTEGERAKVRDYLAQTLDEIRGKGIKLQHFAARFHHLEPGQVSLHLFLYLTRSGAGLTVEEVIL